MAKKTAKATAQPADDGAKPAAKALCFVIMPFGGYFDTYYASIYKPAIEEVGLIPKRADDLNRPSSIVHDIWAFTQQAHVVLGDLTGRNPNVFYELGLAHAIAKPVVMIAETIADVPFDLRALRVIEYDKNAPDWGAQLRERIQDSLLEVLEEPAKAVPPPFLKVKEGEAGVTVTEHQKELLEIKQDVELLRQELARRLTRPRPDPFHSSAVSISQRLRKEIITRDSQGRIIDIRDEDIPDGPIMPVKALGNVPDPADSDDGDVDPDNQA